MSPSAAWSGKTFTESFISTGPGHAILVKPGESLTYYVEQASTATGTLQLEYSMDGGSVYKVEYSNTGSIVHSISASGLAVLNTVKNETPKNKLYRWRCTSYTSGTLTPTLFKQAAPAMVVQGNVVIIVDNDAPVNGTDGDGISVAGRGSLYIDTEGAIYRNEGTSSMVDWKSI